MKPRRNPLCWPLFSAAAVVLLLLLAAGAARYYPAGVLRTRRDRPSEHRTLVVMPLFDAVPDDIVAAEPEPEDDAPPPEPDAFRSLWDGWVAGQALEVWNAAALPDDAVVLEIPLASWERLFHAPTDTTAMGVLARSGLLWDQRWQELKPWAEIGHHVMRAERYQAMKKSVFNENWLESEHLE